MQRLCACGCGQPTPVAKQTNRRIGHVKGEQVRYIRGHYRFNHGIARHSKGYILKKEKGHSRADKRGYVPEHILIAEKAIGKPLPSQAVVHHSNGDTNNSFLVVCQDERYHKLLHQRMRAFYACGHASWRKCKHCKQYDEPFNLYISPNGKNVTHRECAKKYYDANKEHFNALQRIRRANKKGQSIG